MKRFSKILSLAVCFLFVITGCSQSKEQVNASTEENIPTSVEVITLKKGQIQNEYIYSGKVKPLNEINVLSTISGKVAEVNFDIGDMVNKDDVLFKIDTTDILNNINNLQASLESANAQINSAKTNVELANGSNMQLQIEQAKGNVNNAETAYENAKLSLQNAEINLNNSKTSIETNKLNLDKAELAYNNAKTDYDTYKALYDVGAIAQTNINQYETALNQAEIALSQAKLAYEQTNSSVDQAEIAYNQAKAALSQALEASNQAKAVYEITANQMPSENKRKAEDALKVAEASKASILAQIKTAEKNLEDAVVKSPITGIVSACNVKADTLLSQGATVPFTIIDMSFVNIEVNVSEQLINNIKVGDIVDTKINAISEESIKAQIKNISPSANTAGTYTVKLEIENKDNKLKSGMFGEVYFTREKSSDTIILPRSAVISNDNETYVMIVSDNIAKKVNVTLGVDTGDEVEILSGLEENMKVVTKGQTYLIDGDTVEIVTNELNSTTEAHISTASEEE